MRKNKKEGKNIEILVGVLWYFLLSLYKGFCLRLVLIILFRRTLKSLFDLQDIFNISV